MNAGYENPNDGAIEAQLAAARCGDTAALDWLFRYYNATFQSLASSLIKKYPSLAARSRTETLMQECQLHIWNYIQKDPSRLPAESEKFKAFVIASTENQAITMLRHATRKKRHNGQAILPLEQEPIDEATSVTDQVDRALVKEPIEAAIANLQPTDRQIVLDYLEKGLSFDAIAESLGMSKDAVQQRYYRALKKLRIPLSDL